jgi:hypothetical protein
MHVTTRRRLRRRQRWNHAELALINLNARIVLCGMISQYSATAPVPGPANLANILFKRAQMEGFICIDHVGSRRGGHGRAAEIAAAPADGCGPYYNLSDGRVTLLN